MPTMASDVKATRNKDEIRISALIPKREFAG